MTVTLRDEEAVNAATHALGLALALIGAVAVVWTAAKAGSAWQIGACTIYAVTLVAAFAASTLSHLFREPCLRRTFRIADQAIIFLFIAGTYTPIALTWLHSGLWWVMNTMVWGVALAGFVSKAAFAHRVHLGTVSIALYVVLGWMPMLAFPALMAAVPRGLMSCLLGGGLCYTAGMAFFHFDDRVPYFHAAWHVLVMAGGAWHYLGVLFYCTKVVSGQ